MYHTLFLAYRNGRLCISYHRVKKASSGPRPSTNQRPVAVAPAPPPQKTWSNPPPRPPTHPSPPPAAASTASSTLTRARTFPQDSGATPARGQSTTSQCSSARCRVAAITPSSSSRRRLTVRL